MQDDYNRAIADFTQAIRIDPNYALAYSNRGSAYLQKGDYDIAIADCTQAIRLFPDFFIPPYINRGFAYMFEGNYRQAHADAEKALQIDPYNESAQKLLAELQSKGY
jgi:tetratricopeptide (TPR) repeat protein